jgi:hypothetical protein
MTEEPEVFYDVPEMKQFSPFQWFCVGSLYIVVLLLLSFIIYISATWNKVRINEYT